MAITPEIQHLAETLGLSLKDTPAVQKYLQAQAALEADAEIYAKEQQLQRTYTDLLTRQQAGEQLSHAEVAAYNTLREEVMGHPLVAARDSALSNVKTLFADAAGVISALLGVDYTNLITH